jgi:hypothetical protein
MPPSLPAAHVVNLMTNEGSGTFGVQWRVADVRIVEVPAAMNKDRYKTTYQIEPRAMPTDFDDSQWERIEGKDLGVRRSGGHNAFMWFRGLLTMPAGVGDFDLSKPAVAVLNVLVDDYAEVWIKRPNAAPEWLSQPGYHSGPQHAQSRGAWHRSQGRRQIPGRSVCD